MDKENLIYKWLNGQLTGEEKKAFEQLPDYDLNVKIIEGAKRFKAPEFPVEKKYAELKSRLKHHKNESQYFNPVWLYRMAAIFIIALTAYFYIQSNTVEIKTLAFEKKQVVLPDASIVWLNAHSKLTYNRLLWQLKRQLKMSGDAFFKVTKGSRFDVNTPSGIVSVVGTEFEVKAGTEIFEVRCFEGVVKVKIHKKTVVLTHGEALQATHKQIQKIPVLQPKPEWLDNDDQFKSVPLSTVLQAIEKQYKVKIKTQDIDTNQLYTGAFARHNLKLALKALVEAFGLTYRYDETHKIVLISAN